MRRASRSATYNIVEGYGRFHFKEDVQYCRISRGSLYELLDQFITAMDEEYISDVENQKYKKQISECLAVLNGYINYLNKMA